MQAHTQKWNDGHRHTHGSRNSQSIYELTRGGKITNLTQVSGACDGEVVVIPDNHCPRLKGWHGSAAVEARCAWDNPDHIVLELRGLSPAQAISALDAIRGESCS